MEQCLMYTKSAKSILLESMRCKILSIESCKYLQALKSQVDLDIEDRLAICILEQSVWNGDIEIED